MRVDNILKLRKTEVYEWNLYKQVQLKNFQYLIHELNRYFIKQEVNGQK